VRELWPIDDPLDALVERDLLCAYGQRDRRSRKHGRTEQR
jgi:hypothetical protein